MIFLYFALSMMAAKCMIIKSNKQQEAAQSAPDVIRVPVKERLFENSDSHDDYRSSLFIIPSPLHSRKRGIRSKQAKGNDSEPKPYPDDITRKEPRSSSQDTKTLNDRKGREGAYERGLSKFETDTASFNIHLKVAQEEEKLRPQSDFDTKTKPGEVTSSDTKNDLESDEKKTSLQKEIDSLICSLDKSLTWGKDDLGQFHSLVKQFNSLNSQLQSSEIPEKILLDAKTKMQTAFPKIKAITEYAIWMCTTRNTTVKECIPFNFDAYSGEVYEINSVTTRIFMEILFSNGAEQQYRPAIDQQVEKFANVEMVETDRWRELPQLPNLVIVRKDISQMLSDSKRLMDQFIGKSFS